MLQHSKSFTLSATWRQTLGEGEEDLPSDDAGSDAESGESSLHASQLHGLGPLSDSGAAESPHRREALGTAALPVQPQRRSKQWHAVEEILRTEEEYHAALEHVVENFVTPLQVLEQNAISMKYTPPLSITHVRNIFQNVQSIATVHAELIDRLRTYKYKTVAASSSKVKVKEADANANAGVGDAVLRARIMMICRAFEDILPFLNMYKSYAAGFDGAQTTLAEIPVAARRWIENQQATKLVKWPAQSTSNPLQQLDSLLIRPIQRIPRYKMLFEALEKRTDKDDTELRAVLVKLMNGVRKIAGDINDEVRARENRAKVYAIQQSLQKKVKAIGIDLAQPHRWFISECECKVFCPPRSGAARDGMSVAKALSPAVAAPALAPKVPARPRRASEPAAATAPAPRPSSMSLLAQGLGGSPVERRRVAKVRRVVLFNDCILIDRRRQVDLLPLRHVLKLESETVGGGVPAPSWTRLESPPSRQSRRLSFLGGVGLQRGGGGSPSNAGSIYVRLKAAPKSGGGEGDALADEIDQFVFIGQSSDRAFTEWLLALNLVIEGKQQRSRSNSVGGGALDSEEGTTEDEEDADEEEEEEEEKKETLTAKASATKEEEAEVAPVLEAEDGDGTVTKKEKKTKKKRKKKKKVKRPMSIPPRPTSNAPLAPRPTEDAPSVPLTHDPTVLVDARFCDQDDTLTPRTSAQVPWAPIVAGTRTTTTSTTTTTTTVSSKSQSFGSPSTSTSTSTSTTFAKTAPPRRSLSSVYRARKNSSTGQLRRSISASDAAISALTRELAFPEFDERGIALEIQATLTRTRRRSDAEMRIPRSRGGTHADLDPAMFSILDPAMFEAQRESVSSSARGGDGSGSAARAPPSATAAAASSPSEKDANALADALGRTPAEAKQALIDAGGNMNVAAELLLAMAQVQDDAALASRLSRNL